MIGNLRRVASLFLFCLLLNAAGAEMAKGESRLMDSRTPAAEMASDERQVTDGRTSPGARIELQASNPGGVEFEFVADDFEVIETRDGVTIAMPGADRLAEPGAPDLPGRIVLIGIPRAGDIRLSVTTHGTTLLSGLDIAPMAGFGPEVQRLESVFGKDRTWPAAAAELVGIEIVRDVRVARIRLNPVQYNPVRRTVEVHRRVQVSVSFEQAGQAIREFDAFDPVLKRVLLNGEQAVSWKVVSPVDQDSVNFFHRSDVWCKVKTETTGVYGITPVDLVEAGFATEGIDPATFRLYSIGEYEINGAYPDTMIEIPVYVQGESDGRFDGSDYIAFHAESPEHWDAEQVEWESNPFTRYGCFWLTWGGEPGARMATIDGGGALNPAATATRHDHLEQDRHCPARSGLLWLWEQYFKQAGLAATTYDLALDLPNRETWQELTLRFYARTAANSVRLYLNGIELDTMSFTGSIRSPRAADITVSDFPAGVNDAAADTLTIEFFGDPEMEVFLDYAEVRYVERLAVSDEQPLLQFSVLDSGPVEFGIEGAAGDVLLLDVTDPYAPRRITGTAVTGGRRDARVEVSGLAEFACVLTSGLRVPVAVERRYPGALRDLAGHVHYFIICPDEFHAAGRMFARYRDGNVAGITDARARAVKLSEIYDDYGFGIEEPGAIKAFLASKQPEYGMLAGDATYDYKNNLNVERPPSVPAYEVGYDIYPEVYGSVAKAIDAWYADFEGGGDSPDMILSRITCRSRSELRRFMDKVQTYEEQPFGFWAKKILLLADDEWEGSPDKPDQIGFAHIGGCEEMLLYTRDLLDPVKVYLTEYRFTGTNDKAAARAELLTRLNQGALLWFFFGHGAGFQLCHERALHIDGVPGVINGSRNPIGFFGSCGVGRFEDTRYEAVAEELARKESGCLATMAATKATHPGSNEHFARRFITTLFDSPDYCIGPAFYDAWLNVNTLYHLFGDPAVRLKMPTAGLEPVAVPDTFRPGAVVTATDSVPLAAGMYAVSVHEADWFRSYSSEAGSKTYILPGYEIHQATGSFDSGRADCSFMVPKIDYPDTVVVPDGSYARMDTSSLVSFLCWDGTVGYTSRLGGIALGDTVATRDSTPPVLEMRADGLLLSTVDTVRVPGDFTLTGVLDDESGILLASVPDYGLSFYVGAGVTDRVDLSVRFNYDKNSVTRGRFSYPVTIDQEVDSLTVIASDNLRNRCLCTYFVRTQLSNALKLDECLVYPNPVSGPAYFTFELSRAAFVSVKIYTISGRLVRRLPERLCGFGYSQIEWDGKDKEGGRLANGVYLYKLDARSSETSTGTALSSSTTHRDKLIVRY